MAPLKIHALCCGLERLQSTDQCAFCVSSLPCLFCDVTSEKEPNLTAGGKGLQTFSQMFYIAVVSGASVGAGGQTEP